MITQEMVFFYSSIGILVLYFSWSFPYKAYRIDEFRFKMFALRDGLFDYAAENERLFSHTAYQSLRHMMNGSIRYAHNISFWVFLFTMLSPKLQTILNNMESPWDKCKTDLEDLPLSTQHDLEQIHKQYRVLMLSFMVKKSLLFFLLFNAIIPLAKRIKSIKEWQIKKENDLEESGGMKMYEGRCFNEALESGI